MNKFYIFFLIVLQVFTFNLSYGQPTDDTIVIIYYQAPKDFTSDKTKIYDTIFPGALNRQMVLIGNSALIGSKNNRYSELRYGLRLKNVEGTECLDEDIRMGGLKKINKIISITKDESSVIIDMKIVETCCNFFLGEVECKNDSVISLNYFSYGHNCECTCCYGLKFYINDFDFGAHKMKYFMINNEEKTITEYEKSR